MKSKFGKKFRIITAIEKNDIRLLVYLLQTQSHAPEKAVDKLGNNIFHIACSLGTLQMVQFIHNTYHLDIQAYNTDGMNSMHLAACAAKLDIMMWLDENGVKCHSETLFFHRTSHDIICHMLKKNEPPDGHNILTKPLRKKLIEIRNYLQTKYFQDMRDFEIRKFFWIYLKLKQKDESIGKLTTGIIREVTGYF